MGIILNKSWVQKPPVGSQINWGHPLSKGLVGCWLMNEGSGNLVYDMTSSNHGRIVTGPKWTMDKEGRAINFNGSSGYIDLGFSTKLQPSKFTVFSVASTTTVGAGIVAILKSAMGGVNNENSGFMLCRNTSNVRLYVRNAANAWVYSTSGGIVANVFYSMAGTFDGLSTRLYLDGLLQDTDACVGILYGTVGIGAHIGEYSDDEWSGPIRIVLLYDRVLSPSENRQLHYSPDQFISTPRRRFYSIPSTPPTTTGLGIMTLRTSWWGDL